MASPQDCSRYKTCSANVCPLDYQWDTRNHLDNDRVCTHLIKAARNETSNESPEVWDTVKNKAPIIWLKHTRIKKKCFKNQ